MSEDNKVFTICGSTRYMKEMQELALRLTWQGHVVLKPECDMKTPHSLWANPEVAERGKKRLDDVHRAKIRLCDEIIVVGDHIGRSTRAEISYAALIGKKISFLEMEGFDES